MDDPPARPVAISFGVIRPINMVLLFCAFRAILRLYTALLLYFCLQVCTLFWHVHSYVFVVKIYTIYCSASLSTFPNIQKSTSRTKYRRLCHLAAASIRRFHVLRRIASVKPVRIEQLMIALTNPDIQK